MKSPLALSYLIVLSAAVAVVSTEATLQQQNQVLSGDFMSSDVAPLGSVSSFLRRRLEEGADEDQNQSQDEEEENNDSADENEDEAEENEDEVEENEEEESGEEESEEGEGEGEDEDNSADENDAGDDGNDEYIFYDDVAIQNCEEGDEDCEKAATYAAYDDVVLANCEEDDEECNNAAAYTNAKKNQEQEETTNPWDYKNYTDKYNTMSKTSKTWFIGLAVWFALLAIFTCYLCCCRKGYVSKRAAQKPLKESLIDGSNGKSNGKTSVNV